MPLLVGVAVPQNAQKLAVGAERALLIDQIREQLHRAVTAERKRLPVHKQRKRTAPHHKRIFIDMQRKTQMAQLPLDILLGDGLGQEAAGVDPIRLKAVFRMPRDKDDVQLLRDLRKPPCRLDAVDTRHLNIQKNDLHAVLPQDLQRLRHICGSQVCSLRVNPREHPAHQLRDRRLVVDRKCRHRLPPPRIL